EYLYQEQVEFLVGEQEQRKLVFASPSEELAAPCARQLTVALQQTVEPAALVDLDRHRDADFVFASFADMRDAMTAAPGSDVRGLVVHLNADALERIVRLMDDATLGLVARSEQAVPHLIHVIRQEIG